MTSSAVHKVGTCHCGPFGAARSWTTFAARSHSWFWGQDMSYSWRQVNHDSHSWPGRKYFSDQDSGKGAASGGVGE